MTEKLKSSRKRRTDRAHIIYLLTNCVTSETYIGMAVCVDRAGKETLAARWSRHVGRAFNQDKGWKLCESIRKYGPEVFHKILTVRPIKPLHMVFSPLTKILPRGRFRSSRFGAGFRPEGAIHQRDTRAESKLIVTSPHQRQIMLG